MAFTTPVARVAAFGATPTATTANSSATTLTSNTTLVFLAWSARTTAGVVKPTITDDDGGLSYTEIGEVVLSDGVNPELRLTAYRCDIGTAPGSAVTFTVSAASSSNVGGFGVEWVTSECGTMYIGATDTRTSSTTDITFSSISPAPGANDATLACYFMNGTNNISTPAGHTALAGANGTTVGTNRKLQVGYDIVSPASSIAAVTTNNVRQVGLVVVIPAPSAGAYDIDAGAGSYALTGTAATPKHAWITGAGAGSYTLTGTAATPRHDWRVSAGVGSYTLTGASASLLHAWKTVAGAG